MHVMWPCAHQDAACVVVFQPYNMSADIWLMSLKAKKSTAVSALMKPKHCYTMHIPTLDRLLHGSSYRITAVESIIVQQMYQTLQLNLDLCWYRVMIDMLFVLVQRQL